MIYECPQCSAPQEAGVTACRRCGAQFDGPVPDDAIMPPEELIPADKLTPAAEVTAGPELQSVALPEAAVAAVPDEPKPTSAEPAGAPAAVANNVAPPLEEVKPPAADSVPEAAPYMPPPYPYSPSPPAAPPQPMRPPLNGLTKALLFAFPIVLVLVLGGVYFANALNSQSDNLPVTTNSAPAPAPAAVPPPAPVGTPVVMQGGSNTNGVDNDPRTKMLVGRWEAKSLDFYVFNSSGTGSRGSGGPQAKEAPFLWGLVQNRLMLYGDTNEMLRFSPGPDDNTILLGSTTGRYIQYRRAKS